MKTRTTLNCLLLLIPFNLLAHPGHVGAIADSAHSTSLYWSLAALLTLGIFLVAIRLYRRRNSVRADD